MALGTPVTLGQTASAVDANSYTHTTTALVTSGSLVVVAAFWTAVSSAQTIVVSGGGLTWTDNKAQTGVKGTNNFGNSIWSAPAPAGLVTSTVLTVAMTPTGTTTGAMDIAACYIPGGGAVETTQGQFDSTAITSPWTLTGLTSDEDIVIIGALGTDAAGTVTTTATGSTVELSDFEASNNIALHLFYRGPTGGAGTFTLTGTFSAAADSDTIAQVAYNGQAATQLVMADSFAPIPFMH